MKAKRGREFELTQPLRERAHESRSGRAGVSCQMRARALGYSCSCLAHCPWSGSECFCNYFDTYVLFHAQIAARGGEMPKCFNEVSKQRETVEINRPTASCRQSLLVLDVLIKRSFSCLIYYVLRLNYFMSKT